jgi:hypothetical protein
VSTRTTCGHCGQVILSRGDGVWFSRGITVPVTSDCNDAPDGLHAPASAEQNTDPEVLRLRARVAELEAELGR